jgi:hypothetical protein
MGLVHAFVADKHMIADRQRSCQGILLLIGLNDLPIRYTNDRKLFNAFFDPQRSISGGLIITIFLKGRKRPFIPATYSPFRDNCRAALSPR